ncbi:hypothetical protein SAMN05444266_10834 [Chitinophaga jiangningensis]|uniref:Uncharacterized protein n=1 Tax=Chitinophaga jiangningensis TaxID=1419482 RepID=A0A1M7IN91_9BACT|nr:hypothetical protein [Chitinophaga jiangningensis]SHM42272.1 hypothetical protein SAMN05444266_10834 [Chitinophaga jiangningensis]
MKGISTQAIHVYTLFNKAIPKPQAAFQIGTLQYEIVQDAGDIWLLTTTSTSHRVAYRIIHSGAPSLRITALDKTRGEVTIQATCDAGVYTAVLTCFTDETGCHLSTTFSPTYEQYLQPWGRDVYPLPYDNSITVPAGSIHYNQVAARTGLLFFSSGETPETLVLYWQNLSALSPYCEATQTSVAGTVGGNWPEVGFLLPGSAEHLLQPGTNYIINDAYILSEPANGADTEAISAAFMHMLAVLYKKIPRPELGYFHWPEIADCSLKELAQNHGCWQNVKDKSYLNAYYCDYDNPAEIMVQLAVLRPLKEYSQYKGMNIPLINDLCDNVYTFYDERLKTLVRWLPNMSDQLKNDEDHKEPEVMDSWYLYHPMMHLLACEQMGIHLPDSQTRNMLEFGMRVARHFNYEWPVMYNIYTLEVVRAEAREGEGGENDVPGLYAYVMLKAWELYQEDKYLREAYQAAGKLFNKGFKLMYQANNTAFAAVAALKLYQATGEQRFAAASVSCIAALYSNMWIWHCDYGHGKNWNSFFAVFPLREAPYTAAYEENEVMMALTEYLELATALDIQEDVLFMVCEFLKYLPGRCFYYYPFNLPEDMVSDKPKEGQPMRHIYIPLEDLQEGWNQSGTVGLEIYGAGIPFSIYTRYYHQLPDSGILIYAALPIKSTVAAANGKYTITFYGTADNTGICRLIPADSSVTLRATIARAGAAVAYSTTPEKHLKFEVSGSDEITITLQTDL